MDKKKVYKVKFKNVTDLQLSSNPNTEVEIINYILFCQTSGIVTVISIAILCLRKSSLIKVTGTYRHIAIETNRRIGMTIFNLSMARLQRFLGRYR